MIPLLRQKHRRHYLSAVAGMLLLLGEVSLTGGGRATVVGDPEIPPVQGRSPTVRIGLVSSGSSWLLPPSLLPAGPEAWVMRQVFGPGLMAHQADGDQYRLTALASEMIELPREGRLFFTLVPGHRFHHGVNLTPEDIRGTYHLYRDLARAGDVLVDPAFAYLDSVIVDSALGRVGLVMPTRHYALGKRMATHAPLPPEMWRGVEGTPERIRAHIQLREPAGLGAYRFEMMPPDRSRNGAVLEIHLRAVDRSPDGQPEFREVIVQFYRDDHQLIQAFVTGQIDVARLPSFEAVKLLQRQMEGGYVERSFIQHNHFFFLAFNHALGPLQKADVRWGIAHAIDRPGLLDAVGRDHVADLPIHPRLERRSLSSGARRPVTANNLLLRAGYTRRGNVLFDEGGQVARLHLIYPDNGSHYERIAREIKNSLGRIGFDIVPVPLRPDIVGQRLYGGDYELAVFEMTLPPTPEALLRLYHSRGAASGINFLRYGNRTFDSNIEAVVLRADIAESARQGYLDGAFDKLREDLPLLPLFFQGHQYFAINPRIVDVTSMGRMSQSMRPLVLWRRVP